MYTENSKSFCKISEPVRDYSKLTSLTDGEGESQISGKK